MFLFKVRYMYHYKDDFRQLDLPSFKIVYWHARALSNVRFNKIMANIFHDNSNMLNINLQTIPYVFII